MGELKGVLSGISVWDLSHDPEKMAEAEIILSTAMDMTGWISGLIPEGSQRLWAAR